MCSNFISFRYVGSVPYRPFFLGGGRLLEVHAINVIPPKNQNEENKLI